MKRFALIAFALAAAAAPASAQYVSDAEPFITAVRERDGNKVTEMIDKRPTIVNSRNLKGETALVIAISRTDELWTTYLLGKGANPNLATSTGDTPLMAAARVGYTQAIEYLLALGAKVDATNKMGETALILAVQNRELDAVKMLLAKGADPDKKDAAAGYSARDYAKRDTRSKTILTAIETAGKPAPKKDDLDSFKL